MVVKPKLQRFSSKIECLFWTISTKSDFCEGLSGRHERVTMRQECFSQWHSPLSTDINGYGLWHWGPVWTWQCFLTHSPSSSWEGLLALFISLSACGGWSLRSLLPDKVVPTFPSLQFNMTVTYLSHSFTHFVVFTDRVILDFKAYNLLWFFYL